MRTCQGRRESFDHLYVSLLVVLFFSRLHKKFQMSLMSLQFEKWSGRFRKKDKNRHFWNTINFVPGSAGKKRTQKVHKRNSPCRPRGPSKWEPIVNIGADHFFLQIMRLEAETMTCQRAQFNSFGESIFDWFKVKFTSQLGRFFEHLKPWLSSRKKALK